MNRKPGDNCDCGHKPALHHDRWGCKLCGCNLNFDGGIFAEDLVRRRKILFHVTRLIFLSMIILSQLFIMNVDILKSLFANENPETIVIFAWLSFFVSIFILTLSEILQMLSDAEAERKYVTREEFNELRKLLEKTGFSKY